MQMHAKRDRIEGACPRVHVQHVSPPSEQNVQRVKPQSEKARAHVRYYAPPSPR